ncbi:hypothetical protein KY334_03580 [Candidatus Woesearchaeota archaeon]|nr:hypothetical protein [Candidatus Woesearchaeota archaeon]
MYRLTRFLYPRKKRVVKRIAMHVNDLNVRGVATSVFKYASFLVKKYDVVIIYDKNSKFNDELGINKFYNEFEVFGYSEWSEVDRFLVRKRIDLLYMQKHGNYDGKISKKVPTVVHSVFQAYEPHGNVYAYISEWLANKFSSKFVPYIVDLVKPNENLRRKLGIPKNALVFGRHGAFTQFNLDFVQKAVYDIAKKNKNIYFLFMNTKPFCKPLKNIIHIDKSIDEQFKSNFINTCDAMIHAREMGESFGLAVAEFLFLDKPVISFYGGYDKNHIFMLKNEGMWYKDYDSFKDRILNFKRLKSGSYKELVKEFSPEKVIDKFIRVFT